ncbi:MAG: hypothetical protein VXX95_00445 [Candidatus Thermoplasmatota archaeon]|jgi:hypothetical protein|nr:hypothetical protein [Candidatus Thermoplasmatota archaeon]MEC7279719.1 hypothetical protein [Candidatus Thermoplasmatota archaeon]MEC7460804.1 hypothetical protein [Candidatus Thermoplasmatota archaeon]MEC7723697.1 hypothetical protein [Candidatus Thermoplasmatota archaeon]MEC8078595.1 hypothetical protein [Candidatus Thermoplasmatota archaeon]
MTQRDPQTVLLMHLLEGATTPLAKAMAAAVADRPRVLRAQQAWDRLYAE